LELLHDRVVYLGRLERETLMLPPTERFRPARADWLQAALIAAVLFGLYASTAVRTVATEDDSLFVLSSYFLGIEHPPGYPLFTLIGHSFSQLPFGSVAFRVHLASGLFGALTGAAAWLCARALIPGRLPGYLVALGLGVSPVFWSQAIIAEVYTLNTFFFLVLVYLGLQACPPAASGPGGEPHRRILPWMALIFGLSLSNHYPLMLLVAPAFVVLLWPLRADLLRSMPLLLWLVMLGLLPYAWMVYRSWKALPISFYGPLETLPEIWFFLSRAGYAEVDQSVTADWIDRIKFFEFLASELFVQFAAVGTLLAVTGFVAQWRMLGRRVASFLTVAFLMPSAALLVLLNFDYDSLHKHIFQVYPLPAYAVASLWMGLGFAWLLNRFALRAAHAAVLCFVLVAAIFGVGARENVFADEEWIARYAQTLLRILPKDAIVFGRGDPDLAPMAYFHMIESWRPDITLYQSQGLVLGNRLFHPQRTDDKTVRRILSEMIEEQSTPVVTTLGAYALGAQRDRWLYSERDPSASDPSALTVDIPEEAVRFFEQEVLQKVNPNTWVAVIQGELRRSYGSLLGRSLSRGTPIDARTQRELELLGEDFAGALGVAEGLLLNKKGYSAGVVASYLDKAKDLMPSDVPKEYLGRFFHLRGALRAPQGDQPGAVKDLETSISIWRSPKNPAIGALEDLYRDTGDTEALKALQERAKAFKRPRF
jgi:transmembrane protein TMEM260 (protein O-mannosyltransferase)